MAVSLLVEHLRWISLSRLGGTNASPGILSMEYNDFQSFTNSIASATLSVVKVGSEMQ